MYANAKKEVVNDWDQYIDEKGTTYPLGFPKSEIPGLTKVTEIAKPADKIVTSLTIDASYKQVWQVRDKTHQEIYDEALAKVIASRVDALGSADNQLNYMFENGFDAWKSRVAQVHQDNPLPVL